MVNNDVRLGEEGTNLVEDAAQGAAENFDKISDIIAQRPTKGMQPMYESKGVVGDEEESYNDDARQPRVSENQTRSSESRDFALTRESEEREPDFMDTLDSKLSLVAPPAREGFKQGWCRTTHIRDDKVDDTNIMKWQRRGWRPRAIDTIDERHRIPTSLNLSAKDETGVFRIADMVLMEIPEERHAQLMAQKRSDVRRNTDAINKDLIGAHEKRSNMKFYEERTQQVWSDGKRPNVAPDE